MQAHIKRKGKISKSTSTLVRQDELGNSLDNFKTKIFSNLSEQVEMLRMQNEQKEDVDIFLSMQNHTLINVVHHSPGLKKFTKKTMEQGNHQRSYAM